MLAGREPHNHGREELAAQPCATAWGHTLLNDGHLHGRFPANVSQHYEIL